MTATTTVYDAYQRRAWAGRAQAYERSYGLLCAHTVPELLDAAGLPAPGPGGTGPAGGGTGPAGRAPRLLDVGTGPGTVAAAAVARGARVTAVDAEPSMVALAARAVPAADVRQALLPELPFAGGAFDATVANFVVNHVGRPRAALTELCRVTRPGGRVAVTDWPSAAAPGRALLREAFEAAGVVRPPEIPAVAAADDFPRTESGLAGLLTAAGLAEVSCRTLAWDHAVDPEVWWSGPASGIAALGQSLMRQPPEVVAEVRRRFDALAAGFRGGDGLLVLPHTALVATGVVVGDAPGCHLG